MGWLERLSLQAETGDLFEQRTAAVAFTVNDQLHTYGALSRRLFQGAGPGFHEALDEARTRIPGGRLPVGEAVAVDRRDALLFPEVKHIVLAALWARENDYTEELIYKITANLLRAAFAVGAGSLAVPVFHVPPAVLQRGMARVLLDFDGLRGADAYPLETLRFVSNRPEVAESLRDALEEDLG
jgi:O-acetyl-ADP-ribose deacetylase (regulator of RNase III)